MRKLLAAGSLVVLSLSMSPAIGGESAAINGMSHQHPADQDFSFVCAKVRGPAGRYIATIDGPAVREPMKSFRLRGTSLGKKKVTFIIEAAGEYTVTLRKASRERILDTKSYNVPAPPPNGAALGPFRCKR